MSKQIVIALYIISVALLTASLYLRSRGQEIEALYWLGLLFAAVAMGMRAKKRKSEK